MDKYYNSDASIKYIDSAEGILNAAENNGRNVIYLLPNPNSIYNSSSRGGGEKRSANNNSHIKGRYDNKRRKVSIHYLVTLLTLI